MRFEKIFTYLTFILFFYFTSSKAQQSAAFLINNGTKFTNAKDKSVILSFSVQRARQMMISNSAEFTNAKWETYLPKKTGWILEGEEGEKTVYVKFKDLKNTESSAINAKIILDISAPKNPFIYINPPKAFTNLKNISLQLSAEDAAYVSISNKSTFQGAGWINYVDTLRWALDEPDGEKIIYAKFKDQAGNISPVVSTKIKLDRIAPVNLSIKINDGAKWTNKKQVTLSLTAADATEMMIKQKKSVWEPFSEKKEITLEGEDGPKIIYVRFKDATGNISESVSATIGLDQQIPKNGKISINKDALFTNQKERKVSLAIECEGATEMIIDNTNDFKNGIWEKYTTIKQPWILSTGDGEKIVYIKFRDAAGNISEITQDKIILDTTPPQKAEIKINNGATITNLPTVKLAISVQEANEMILANSTSFSGSKWEPLQPKKDNWELIKGNGPRSVYARFKDEAGNISDFTYATITLDTLPPTETSIKINDGKNWTNDKERKITLSLNAKNAAEMIVSENPDFAKAKWESFATTKIWTLSSGDGNKVVGVKFKDEAGNISSPVIAKIKLKSTPISKYKISINQDSVYTRTILTNLYISVDYASEMMISNSSEFTNVKWEPFAAKKIWKLDGITDGKKIVYIKLKDPADNMTPVFSDSIRLDRIGPKDGKIIIDKDSLSTNNINKKVILTLSASEANEMVISNDQNFTNAKWEPFKEKKEWVLEGEEGMKIVYAQFRDKAGNNSAISKDNIILDFKPPTDGTIKINNDEPFTNKKEVTLSLNATDAKYMAISNTTSFSKITWEKYTTKRLKWIIDGADGEKTVYIKFKDAAGNTSAVVSDKITLDTKPPYGTTFKINNDSTHTSNKDKKVNLSIDAKDASYILISTNRLFKKSEWENFKKNKPFILDGEDGPKTIYILFKDEAGNISSDTLSKKIILDRRSSKNINKTDNIPAGKK